MDNEITQAELRLREVCSHARVSCYAFLDGKEWMTMGYLIYCRGSVVETKRCIHKLTDDWSEDCQTLYDNTIKLMNVCGVSAI